MKKILLLVSFCVLITINSNAQIAGWDFTGQNSGPATVAATTFNTNLVSTSGASNITRGAGASGSMANNSFRTTGFQNNGINVANTDYFQVTLTANTGNKVSLSTINANLAGTASYSVSPGVSSQFAYSLDGSTFTLIGTAQATIGTPASLTTINLSGITALQNVPAGTTVTLRYYASGQTTTGGWGFISASAGTNGLAIGGTVQESTAPLFALSYPKSENITTTSFDLISNINEIGTTFYVVLPDGATAPTSAQVVAGTDASNAAAGFSGTLDNTIANTDFVKAITGLTTNVPYDVYVVARDASNNLQAAPVKLDVTPTGTLPISLTSFTGKESNNSIVLNWVTASEKNNKNFEILRSVDGKVFKSIGIVNGARDSDAELKYSFIDANPFGGTNYYQLKQIDFDGKSSTSQIIPVDSKIEDTKITVYAASSKVNIGITSPNETSGKLSLFDIGGRKISEQNISLNKGYNTLELNETLTPGVHFITLENEGKLYRQKFIK